MQCMELQTLSQGRRVSVRAAQRAEMILLAGEGHTQVQIAAQVGGIRQTVALVVRALRAQGACRAL